MLEVAAGQNGDEAILHLLVGEVKPIGVAPGIDRLNGEVATLVDQMFPSLTN